MKSNVTYIVSNIDKALAFEWIADNLDKGKFNLSFILLNPDHTYLENFLLKRNIPVLFIKYSGKKNSIVALLQILKFLKKQRTSVVHCHLFDACVIGLAAARVAGIKKRIYTRHHSTSNHVYHPGSVKWDRLCNFLSTDIISISNVVSETLMEKENVAASKISLIHHGFDLALFSDPDPARVSHLRRKYNPNNKYPVVGVISRFLELKGIQYIIPAFKELLNSYPDALLLLFNASGNYSKQINSLLAELPENSFIKIDFENEITCLYHIFDVFVHTPIDYSTEAFGQVYVEALASGIPSVFTISGIANEFIRDNHNAVVVPYKDSNAISAGLLMLLKNPTFAVSLKQNGIRDVSERFGLDKMISSLTKVYVGE